jgi:hypothetical protein
MIDDDTCTFTEPPAIFGDSFRSEVEDLVSKNRRWLEERQPVDPRRKTLVSPSMRMKLLALETGFDYRTGQVRQKLLQPWINPRAMGLLTRIGHDDDGAWTINDLDNLHDLAAVAEMQDRNVAFIGVAGVIHLLSQPKRTGTKKYPGAIRREIIPAAGIDRWVEVLDAELSPRSRNANGLPKLNRIAPAEWDALFMDAVRALQGRRREARTVHAHGIGLTIHEITTEVNRVLSLRDEHGFDKRLHVESCRLIKLRLLGPDEETGEAPTLIVTEASHKEYVNNEWITHPCVYAVLDGVTVPEPLQPIARRSHRRDRIEMAA